VIVQRILSSRYILGCGTMDTGSTVADCRWHLHQDAI